MENHSLLMCTASFYLLFQDKAGKFHDIIKSLLSKSLSIVFVTRTRENIAENYSYFNVLAPELFF